MGIYQAGWLEMTRSISPALLRFDDVDMDDFPDVLAQWQRLGGRSAAYATLMAKRRERRPEARLSRRDDAVIAFVAARFPAPPDRKQREAMASELSLYESTRWRRERMGTVEFAKDAAMFTIMQNSPASGAPGERTIREILGKSQRLLPAHARGNNSNHNLEFAA
jgi:hypothetical protein